MTNRDFKTELWAKKWESQKLEIILDFFDRYEKFDLVDENLKQEIIMKLMRYQKTAPEANPQESHHHPSLINNNRPEN